LHYAAEKGAPADIIKGLLAAGADSRGVDIYGDTPAEIARKNLYISFADYIEQCTAPAKSANLLV
jgi:ankyrin repeat protein